MACRRVARPGRVRATAKRHVGAVTPFDRSSPERWITTGSSPPGMPAARHRSTGRVLVEGGRSPQAALLESRRNVGKGVGNLVPVAEDCDPSRVSVRAGHAVRRDCAGRAHPRFLRTNRFGCAGQRARPRQRHAEAAGPADQSFTCSHSPLIPFPDRSRPAFSVIHVRLARLPNFRSQSSRHVHSSNVRRCGRVPTAGRRWRR